ncbi:hypothetical protein HSX11_14710 [Oxalobacteraceae bacterium]|nr:hypothetical protein [Oxalobacteraceae bacterium]
MITIQLNQQTRKQMNSQTPRDGDWTYHHALPVRYYFTIAYVCAYTALHLDVGSKGAKLARECLYDMANIRANQNKMRLLNGAGKDAAAKLKETGEIAKLCASPLFGGFAGMNPEQRCDDPKEGPELNKPMSADVGWWAAIQLLKIHVEAVFPTVGSDGEKNLDIAIHEDTLESFVDSVHTHIHALSSYPICPFDPSDWKMCPSERPSSGTNWVMAKPSGPAFAWSASKAFDSLNKVKAPGKVAEFNKLWGKEGDALKFSLAGSFALRTLDADPQGVEAGFSEAVKTKAKERPHKVFRQINDLLVLYIPD